MKCELEETKSTMVFDLKDHIKTRMERSQEEKKRFVEILLETLDLKKMTEGMERTKGKSQYLGLIE